MSQAGELRLRFKIESTHPLDEVLDLWYHTEDRFAVRLVTPRGKQTDWITAGAGTSESELASGNQVLVDSVVNHPMNAANRVTLFLGRGKASELEMGEWTLVIRGDVAKVGGLDVWLQRWNGSNSSFVDRDQFSTISMPGTSPLVLTVGSHTMAGLRYFSASSNARIIRSTASCTDEGASTISW